MEKIAEEVHSLLNVSLTDKQVVALTRYGQELSEWNRRHSLTAIQHPEKVRVKHFLDSFSAI